jgi:hypothetical protein
MSIQNKYCEYLHFCLQKNVFLAFQFVFGKGKHLSECHMIVRINILSPHDGIGSYNEIEVLLNVIIG